MIRAIRITTAIILQTTYMRGDMDDCGNDYLRVHNVPDRFGRISVHHGDCSVDRPGGQDETEYIAQALVVRSDG